MLKIINWVFIYLRELTNNLKEKILKTLHMSIKFLKRSFEKIKADRYFIILSCILYVLTLDLSRSYNSDEPCLKHSFYIFFTSSRVDMECIGRRNQNRKSERAHEIEIIKAEQNSKLMNLLAKYAIEKEDSVLVASYLAYLGSKDPNFLISLATDEHILELRNIISEHYAKKESDLK